MAGGVVTQDQEIVALTRIVRVLQKLPYPMQERVMRFLQERYSQQVLTPQPGPPTREQLPPEDRFAGATPVHPTRKA